ncbi:peptidase [Pseudoalteromonas ruthenica]|uniref:pesticin C-terminus-like muramidase n=1 Tax=Pseudoalteromonas ruthenica TaxID=151081 RepID=UPI0011085368|nr:pesticin C-terminus-like muramidase [Pseudoalteromonas ruthenica]TLX50937.1 peptidase [Pseudoalteromonas ruthenica]
MTIKIDYDFISSKEGGRKLEGYVPAVAVSNSGVTIATGFDLGQRNKLDLIKLGISQPLTQKLLPYLSLKKNDALKALKKSPLKVTPSEALQIDKSVKSQQIIVLVAKYNSATKTGVLFADLPSEAQTVIASVAFQYGDNLSTRTPDFWDAATRQDWKMLILELRNFGDMYPTRRNSEADLLEKIK